MTRRRPCSTAGLKFRKRTVLVQHERPPRRLPDPAVLGAGRPEHEKRPVGDDVAGGGPEGAIAPEVKLRPRDRFPDLPRFPVRRQHAVRAVGPEDEWVAGGADTLRAERGRE